MDTRLRLALSALVGTVLLLGAHCARGQEGGDEALRASAEAFVDQLVAGQYAQAVAVFDATMTRVMPEVKLKEMWEQLEGQVGAFQQRLGTKVTQDAGFGIATVTCAFKLAVLDMRVVYDAAGRVAGLRFSPGEAPDTYTPPAYVNQDAFTEEEVTVGTGEWALPGTLTLPKGDGPFPALVLVHGSGPQDRDETIGPNKPFRDLAWGLATQGIAVLRYEKRTKQHALKLVGDNAGLTIDDETVEDALLAVELLRARAEIKQDAICVLGHSLGGMMIPRIGQRGESIAGLIIMAGTTRPLEEVTIEQVDYILSLGRVNAQSQEVLEGLKAGAERVRDADLRQEIPADEPLFGAPLSYWRDLRAYQPAEVAKSLTQPVLVLQGGRDYQVTKVDYEGWQQAFAGREDVQFRWYDDLNHTFAEGEGMATPDEYSRPSHVAEKVVDDIVGWVKG